MRNRIQIRSYVGDAGEESRILGKREAPDVTRKALFFPGALKTFNIHVT